MFFSAGIADKAIRIFRSALPYFNYYGPFNKITAPLARIMLIAENGKQGISDLTAVWKNKHSPKPYLDTGFQAGRGLAKIAIAIACVAHYPIGIMSNIALEMANHSSGKRDCS
jgi:hypothetical protein